MLLFVNELKIMQDGLRLEGKQLLDMVTFIAKGGRFNRISLEQHNPKRTSLVAITEFEDGERYIRDGLHRSVITFLARDVPVLFEDEFVIEKMTYDMFLEINIENQWYTPFDPRIEVRRADFFDFKEEVVARIKDEDVEEFIRQSKDRYAIPRTPQHTLEDCADAVWQTINPKP